MPYSSPLPLPSEDVRAALIHCSDGRYTRRQPAEGESSRTVQPMLAERATRLGSRAPRLIPISDDDGVQSAAGS